MSLDEIVNRFIEVQLDLALFKIIPEFWMQIIVLYEVFIMRDEGYLTARFRTRGVFPLIGTLVADSGGFGCRVGFGKGGAFHRSKTAFVTTAVTVYGNPATPQSAASAGV